MRRRASCIFTFRMHRTEMSGALVAPPRFRSTHTHIICFHIYMLENVRISMGITLGGGGDGEGFEFS